jgi:CRISPR system Cascade subunit CasA
MTDQTQPIFNLLDEPWIPVRFPDGEVRDISLTQAVVDANRISALAETSPPNLIALYRVLLALLHRALTTHHGPWKDADRARWYREGLPEAPIRAYLDQWRERFWLFHPETPFMQVKALTDAPETREKLKPWTQVCLAGGSGNTPIVFDHAMDEAPSSITAALACRHLLGFLQFTPGGLVKTVRDSDKAGPLSNTAAVMSLGDHLAESLLLNLHPHSARVVDDLPAWEQLQPGIAALRAAPKLATGPNDRYTRISRAVLLVPESNQHCVRHIRFAAGLALEEDVKSPDPMACYRIAKDGKAVRMSFFEGRAVWRELPALVPDPTGKFNQPATVISWATNLRDRTKQFDAPIPVLVAGLASDQAKLLRWRVERVDLPLPLLTDPDAAAEVRVRIREGEELYFRLRTLCAEMIASAMPDPAHKDTRARARTILDNGPTATAFFSSVERALPELMQRIAAGDVDAAYQHWATALKLAAQGAWVASRSALGDSPQALRAQARAFPKVQRLLRALDQPETETTQEEANP